MSAERERIEEIGFKLDLLIGALAGVDASLLPALRRTCVAQLSKSDLPAFAQIALNDMVELIDMLGDEP